LQRFGSKLDFRGVDYHLTVYQDKSSLGTARYI
jgi:hypothetical protein